MPSFKLAHVREQGQDMIFVPLESATLRLAAADHAAMADELRSRTTAAGLAGEVVLCWYELHRWHFFGPQQWRAFFESLPPDYISKRVNRTLQW